MNLKEFYAYKNKFVEQLCSNRKAVSLITNDDRHALPAKDLPYCNVFPYEYLPDTVTDAKTFVCIDVDISQVVNKTTYVPLVYIWVFTHRTLVRLPEGGSRVDALSSVIDTFMNGSRDYGLGELNLRSVGRFSPIDEYQGRVLVYTAVDFNRNKTISHPSPSVRPVNRGVDT